MLMMLETMEAGEPRRVGRVVSSFYSTFIWLPLSTRASAAVSLCYATNNTIATATRSFSFAGSPSNSSATLRRMSHHDNAASLIAD